MKPIVRIVLLTISVLLIALLPFFHMEWKHVAKQVAIQEVISEEITLAIEAPATAEIGELVRLNLSGSAVGVTWKVLPDTVDFEVIDDGKRALFSSRVAGTYQFFIAGAKGDKSALAHSEIIVAGGVVVPDGPQPTIPFSQKIVAWGKKIPEYPGKKTHAAGLAGVFRKMADAKDVKPEQILEATALANSAVLAADLEKWVPFLDLLGQDLDALVTSKALSTRESYREVWLQIATGLETLAK